MIRAIIFDCFGVVVGQGFDTTWRRAGGDPGRDREFIQDLLGAASLGLISSKEMTRRVCNHLGISVATWQSVVVQSEQPDIELLTYVTDTLKHRFKIGMLSNANSGVLQRKLTQSQLDIFDTIIVSAEVGMLKPDSDIYQLTAEHLTALPEECVFVDDNRLYCEAAQAVGMKPIHYQHFEQFKTQLTTILDHM